MPLCSFDALLMNMTFACFMLVQCDGCTGYNPKMKDTASSGDYSTWVDLLYKLTRRKAYHGVPSAWTSL
jgi:hypothetical protein